MNVGIDKKLHQQYVKNKHPNHNQKLITDELVIRNKNPKPDTPPEDSGKTLSYKTWNANSLVNWGDFEDVTGPSCSLGKDPMDNEESEEEKTKRKRMRTPMMSDHGT
jgi:hypothetical protein